MLIRGFLCAALSVLVSGPVMAKQPAPADNTRPRDPLAVQPGATAGTGQAEEIRQLKAAVARLEEQVKQLSGKSDQRDSQGRSHTACHSTPPCLTCCLAMTQRPVRQLQPRQKAKPNRPGECTQPGRTACRLRLPMKHSACMSGAGCSLTAAGMPPARRYNSAREASANCRTGPSCAGRGSASTARCTSISSGWRNLISPTTSTTTPPPAARLSAVQASRTSGQ